MTRAEPLQGRRSEQYLSAFEKLPPEEQALHFSVAHLLPDIRP